MRYLAPLLLVVMLLAGLSSCKKNPVAPKPDTTTHCDTCTTDTTHKHCDTCNVDTSHHPPPNPGDTSSHVFTWTQSTIPGEAGLTGCWVFGPKSIYVVGGSVWKYDGGAWSNVTPVDSRGYSLVGALSGSSVFAFAESDYWLTYGFIGHVINGVRLKYPFGTDTVGFLHASWGTSSTNMYTVGDGGTILHFNGTTWTRMASGTTKNL